MTASEWVGAIKIDGPWEFIRITAAPAGADGLIAALPDRGLHRLVVENDGEDTVDLTFSAGGNRVGLRGVRFDMPTSGKADGAADGQFLLWPGAAIDEAAFRSHIGDHEASDGRRISLYVVRHLVSDKPMVLCTEGDTVTRLHAVSSTALLSERLELITVDGSISFRPAVPGARPDETVCVETRPSWTEENVSFASGRITLAGTLVLPKAEGPHPGVVLVHGAGGGRRDFYRLFAAEFARAGVAALIYDKRGVGESEGSQDSSLLDRSIDAEAGFSYLQSRPEIDATRVGLWAFSNGGWSAPMVAARRRDLGFLIVVGAAGVSPAAAEIHRKAFELREQGVPEADIEVVSELWRMIYGYVSVRSWPQGADQRFDQLAAQAATSPSLARVISPWYALDNPILSSIPPFTSHSQLKDQVGDLTLDELAYDPVEAYGDIRCPVLMVLGELDGNVPAKTSAERVDEALRSAGNDSFLIRIVPGAGHMLNLPTPVSGASTEEVSIEFHRFVFAPGVLHLMCNWAREVTGEGRQAAIRGTGTEGS